MQVVLDEAWLRVLPAVDRRAFAQEVIRTVETCVELDSWGPLVRLVDEWRSTAAVHADPTLAKRLVRTVDADLGEVMPPAVKDRGAATPDQR